MLIGILAAWLTTLARRVAMPARAPLPVRIRRRRDRR
jgi:hypothetical protein